MVPDKNTFACMPTPVGLDHLAFVAAVDRGGVPRLVFFDTHPSWLLVVDMTDGRLGVLNTVARSDRPSKPRTFKSFAALRQIEQSYRYPPARTVVPWVPDPQFPYDPERRRTLIEYSKTRD